MSNYKTVFFILGILQIILGVSMIFPIIMQFIFEELDSSFISASIITIIFGTLFFLSNLENNVFSRMSGSGSCCYVVFENKDNAKRAFDITSKKYNDYWIHLAENNTGNK